MALTFPKAQAIRFLESGEIPFNDNDTCGCETSEKWAYQFTTGDNICFQIQSICDESAELIENGSFENGSSSTSITDWARDVDNVENTNVTRELDNTAPCDSYVAKWANVASTPTLARLEQNYTFAVGKTYKVTLKAKIVTGGLNINNILKLVIGGQEYFITPSTSWEQYEIIATFSNAPSTTEFDILMNEIPTDVQFMYVDCVSLIEYGDCCILGHINNGCFELGQRQDETNAATFDNWTTDGVESLTGGYDGGRCVILGIGNTLEQTNVLIDNTECNLKFWARADGTCNLQITTGSSGTIIDTLSLTTTWTQYEYNFLNVTDESIIFLGASDENAYIDCVEISTRPEINVLIRDIEGNEITVNSSVISSFNGGANICIPVDDYDMPSCFQICTEFCGGTVCSENMQFTADMDLCYKELVWYNVDSGDNIVLGVDYASGFVNRIRIKGNFQNPQYIKESFTKTLNGDVSKINSIKIKKTNDFSVDALPEFMVDILAMMLAVSNIEYGSTEWCSVVESEVSPQFDKNSRLMSVAITLSPKGEYIADSSYNCR